MKTKSCVTLSLPGDVVVAIDAIADAEKRTRSQVADIVLRAGLSVVPRPLSQFLFLRWMFQMPVDGKTTDGDFGFRDLQHMAAPVRHPKPRDFQAWPKMLTHPDHEDAVPAKAETVVTTPPINSLELPVLDFLYTPAIPEKWPPRIVNNEAEEAAAVAEGYRAAPGGVQAPVVEDALPHGYKPAPFPKWIAAHNRAVNSFEEELALMSPEERAAARPSVRSISRC